MSLFTKPKRCTLINTHTAERMICQFNPEQLQEKYAVKYAHLEPLGAGHQVLHYTGTENRKLTLEFYLDAIGTGFDVGHFRHFLVAFTQPANLPGPSCPPAMMLVWPNFLTLTVRVIDLAFTFEQFAESGAPTVYTAHTVLEVDATAAARQRGLS